MTTATTDSPLLVAARRFCGREDGGGKYNLTAINIGADELAATDGKHILIVREHMLAAAPVEGFPPYKDTLVSCLGAPFVATLDVAEIRAALDVVAPEKRSFEECAACQGYGREEVECKECAHDHRCGLCPSCDGSGKSKAEKLLREPDRVDFSAPPLKINANGETAALVGRVRMNPTFLGNALAAWDALGVKEVTLRHKEPEDPIVFEWAKGVVIIMPVSVR